MTKEWHWYTGLSLAVTSSFLLLLSFPTYNINILGFIALVPIFTLAYTTSLKRIFLYSLVTAFLFYCLYLFWMNAYLAIVGVSFVTVVYGGYFIVSLLLINVTSCALPKYRVILTPFIWIALEYIRGFGFLGFTFGSMGYTQHNFLRFIQIADIGGEPLVAFIVVLFNAALANIIVLFITQKDQVPSFHLLLNRSIPFAVAVLILIASIVYGNFRIHQPIPQQPKLKIALIQALSSPRTTWKDEKWKTLQRLTDLSKESYLKNPDLDLIVWTETAIRTSLRPNIIYGTPYHMRIVRLIKQLKVHFLIGSPDNFSVKSEKGVNPKNLSSVYPTKGEEEIWTNSAYFLNEKGEIIGKYDKMKLTPFGEHFPLGKKLHFLQKILDKFTDSAGFTPGNRYKLFSYKGLKFGVVICWEGTYGYFIRRFVKEGADFIINISNDMWTRTPAGHFQHFTITKFRSIENRIWYVRAGNDGVTAFINPYGKVVKILPIKKEGYLVGTVGPRVRETLYTKYGDILPRISLAVLVISFIYSLFVLVSSRPQKKPKTHHRSSSKSRR